MALWDRRGRWNGHYEALLTAPHSKKTIRNELMHVWAIWKAWCRMVHDNEEKTSDTFVCLYREFLKHELSRASSGIQSGHKTVLSPERI